MHRGAPSQCDSGVFSNDHTVPPCTVLYSLQNAFITNILSLMFRAGQHHFHYFTDRGTSVRVVRPKVTKSTWTILPVLGLFCYFNKEGRKTGEEKEVGINEDESFLSLLPPLPPWMINKERLGKNLKM